MRNKTVVLYVNTAQIEKPDVDDYCNFGQPIGTSNQEFTILANVDDTITWIGVSSSNGDDEVNITKIKHEAGSNVFGKEEIDGNGQLNERVIGKVINNTQGDNESYILSFTVTHNGKKRNGTFKVDPKIQINN